MFKYQKPEETGLFGGLRLLMAVTAFVAGASFCLSSVAYHRSAVFYYVNQLPIPWFVYGVILLLGGTCMFFARIRPIGFLLAAILYTFFAITIWLSVIGGLHYQFFILKYLHFPKQNVGSFYAACNATTLAGLYWSAVKYSIYVQVDPERVTTLTHK